MRKKKKLDFVQMAIQLPSFVVKVVEEGDRFGILLEKQEEGQPGPTVNYFWSKGEVGLPPVRSIRTLAHECHSVGVVDSKILLELRAFARRESTPEKDDTSKYPDQRYPHRAGYAGWMSNHFRAAERQKSPLRKFIGSYREVYRRRILATEAGQLVGKARAFQLLTTRDIDEFGTPTNLRSAVQLLEHKNPRPAWFRSTGAIWGDFAEGHVFRRSALDRLKQLVDSHTRLLLLGEPGSGKTTLVRHLAYERMAGHNGPTSYFRGRFFDPAALAAEIRSATGLIILEDVHAALPRYQELLSLLPRNIPVTLLFTALPSVVEMENPRHREFAEIAAFELTAFADVPLIAHHFAHSPDHNHLPWTDEDVEAITNRASGDLWRLRAALQGYITCRGKGEPVQWQKAAALEEFALTSQLAPEAPELLVLVAAFFQKETLVSERFVRDQFGFSLDVIQELISARYLSREISSSNESFLVLPSPVIADDYWQHGERYRKLRKIPSLRQLILDYARSDSPNGTESVIRQDRPLRDALVHEIVSMGEARKVLTREDQIHYILDFLSLCPLPVDDNTWLVPLVVQRLNELRSSFELALAWCQLDLLDSDLASACSKQVDVLRRALDALARGDIDGFVVLLSCANAIDERKAHDLFEGARNQIVQHIAAGDVDSTDFARLIGIVQMYNSSYPQDLWRAADKQRLAADFMRLPIQEIVEGLGEIGKALGKQAQELLTSDLVGKISAEARSTIHPPALTAMLRALSSIDPRVSATIALGMDYARLSQKLLSETHWKAAACLEQLRLAQAQVAWQVTAQIDAGRAAEGLIGSVEPLGSARWLSEILRANDVKGTEVYQRLDRDQFARLLASTSISLGGFTEIVNVNRDVGRDLCDRLPIERVVQTMNQATSTIDVLRAERCLLSILAIRPRLAVRIVRLLKNKKLLANLQVAARARLVPDGIMRPRTVNYDRLLRVLRDLSVE